MCQKQIGVAVGQKFWEIKQAKGIYEHALYSIKINIDIESHDGQPKTHEFPADKYYRKKLELLQMDAQTRVSNIRYLSMAAFKAHYDSWQHNILRTKENSRKCIYDDCCKVSQSWYNYVAHIARHNQHLYPWHCTMTVGVPVHDLNIIKMMESRTNVNHASNSRPPPPIFLQLPMRCRHTSSTKDNLKKHIKG